MKQLWKTLATISGLRQIAVLSALFGIPFPISVYTACTFAAFTLGMVLVASDFLLIKVYGCSRRNNVLLISRSKIGQRSLGCSRASILLYTTLYAVPKKVKLPDIFAKKNSFLPLLKAYRKSRGLESSVQPHIYPPVCFFYSYAS